MDIHGINKQCGWHYEYVTSVEDLFGKISRLSTRENRWVFRGVPKEYDFLLTPSIEREPFNLLSTRKEQIALERKAIEIFKFNSKFFLFPDSERLLLDDITTLMLMQHYGAPTRLLDWSLSPLIAAYFAASDNYSDDGVIWCFDYKRYESQGSLQWKKYVEMGEGESFNSKLTPAFQVECTNNWFICQFLYKYKFPRIIAQDGLFSFVSQFNIDHAIKIKELLEGLQYHQIIIIKHELKQQLLQKLNNTYHIWYGSIYPDNIGVAQGTKKQLIDEYKK
jgi:hypothetical protein